MKVADLLTEASLELRQRVAKRLAAALVEMAVVYGKEFAEMEDTSVEDMGLPWKAEISHNMGRGVMVNVERNLNISDSMWEGSVEHIKEVIKEDGYSGGLLPVDVVVALETNTMLKLAVV